MAYQFSPEAEAMFQTGAAQRVDVQAAATTYYDAYSAHLDATTPRSDDDFIGKEHFRAWGQERDVSASTVTRLFDFVAYDHESISIDGTPWGRGIRLSELGVVSALRQDTPLVYPPQYLQSHMINYERVVKAGSIVSAAPEIVKYKFRGYGSTVMRALCQISVDLKKQIETE